MEFRIADTFTDSLARLTGDEQKAVKTTAFDLQVNPASPGHAVPQARQGQGQELLVRAGEQRHPADRPQRRRAACCSATSDHHDKAYDWAERRKLETHPKTGAAQLVEIRETVTGDRRSGLRRGARRAADGRSREAAAVRRHGRRRAARLRRAGRVAGRRADGDRGHAPRLADHLPPRPPRRCWNWPRAASPAIRQLAVPVADPFDHPDAQRRFRVMTNVEELERALDFPWEKWTVFLHPEQRQWVERDYAGPARVSGSAGTGKTIVALHRAAYLARTNPDARVLLTTFSDTLANALQVKLRRLLGNEPRLAERIEVYSLDAIGHAAVQVASSGQRPSPAATHMRELLARSGRGASAGHKFSTAFPARRSGSRWSMPGSWQTWEAYRDVARLGRKTRLPEAQRAVLWSIFERVRDGLSERRADHARAELFSALAGAISQSTTASSSTSRSSTRRRTSASPSSGSSPPWGQAARTRSSSPATSGSASSSSRSPGRRSAWTSAGGLAPCASTTARHTRSACRPTACSGRPSPTWMATARTGATRFPCSTARRRRSSRLTAKARRSSAVGAWIAERGKDGVQPHEFGVFVRSAAQLDRARAAVEAAGLAFKVLDEHVETSSGHVSISTMHLAKGLEFRAVVVMACDDEVIPLQERIETVGDDADLQEVYDTERHLLYVACTRARDHSAGDERGTGVGVPGRHAPNVSDGQVPRVSPQTQYGSTSVLRAR